MFQMSRSNAVEYQSETNWDTHLSSAIVIQARNDLINAVYSHNQVLFNEVCNFFFSKWFSRLCDCEGDYILRKIKEGLREGKFNTTRTERKVRDALPLIRRNLTEMEAQYEASGRGRHYGSIVFNRADYLETLNRERQEREAKKNAKRVSV